jgi:hypothetical protein
MIFINEMESFLNQSYKDISVLLDELDLLPKFLVCYPIFGSLSEN